MTGFYPDFATLARHERADRDYRIYCRDRQSSWAVLAPHGGNIEPGTSELALAIAGDAISCYLFEGIKPKGNRILHLASTRFDEPICLDLLARCQLVLTIHGAAGTDEAVYCGGRWTSGVDRLRSQFAAEGFTVRRHPDPGLQGIHPDNLCNRGRGGAGIQLELSRGFRQSLAPSRLAAFVATVRALLASNHEQG